MACQFHVRTWSAPWQSTPSVASSMYTLSEAPGTIRRMRSRALEERYLERYKVPRSATRSFLFAHQAKAARVSPRESNGTCAVVESPAPRAEQVSAGIRELPLPPPALWRPAVLGVAPSPLYLVVMVVKWHVSRARHPPVAPTGRRRLVFA
ncbi:hypothetical protein PHLGIDRAFT_327348 [Phlebiopsis gigantea 11061_1 CR5-6]|uniref:Uncharacterized protein n=1 Tax=Phlebiopsis gigantea (strain 11061_1 CR5-6) TaxID=745531 RepID=A0A0C3S755_PHLG1|nr:hypothetical protein PHLGIDRAFT_327348 [Phlebiopsis gigantea 11061_1 CR5-6]